MGKEYNKDYFLWHRFKEGDENAFYLLYDQYADALYSFGKCFLKDHDLIKDCIHDLFLDLYKYKGQLSDTDNIRFYLFRSLRRKLFKKQQKFSSFPFNDKILLNQTDVVPAYEDTLIEEEITTKNHRLLQLAMKSLTIKQRKVLSLHFEQDLSYSEIAELFDISIESVRTLVYRSLKILRGILNNEDQTTLQLLTILFHF
jgi:RNA polymerase sigma factor (sigma-70 family)